MPDLRIFHNDLTLSLLCCSVLLSLLSKSDARYDAWKSSIWCHAKNIDIDMKHFICVEFHLTQW